MRKTCISREVAGRKGVIKGSPILGCFFVAKRLQVCYSDSRKQVYEKLVEEDKTFEEAYERLKKASSDEKLMAMYRSREKAIRDWNDYGRVSKENADRKLLQEVKGVLLGAIFL